VKNKEAKTRDRKRRKKWLESEEFFADTLQHPPITEEMIEWFKWKWEFMRRDPQFNNLFSYPLNKVLDPSKTFEELWGTNDVLKTFLYLSDYMPINIGTENNYNYSIYKLKLEIDFTKINSLDDLKKAIIDIIDINWFAYAKKVNHKTIKSKDFERIIKVGDMKRDNPNMPFAEIGKLILPLNDEESAQKQARRDYEDYNRLINGGWKTISYP